MRKVLIVLLALPLVIFLAGCGPSAQQILKDSMQSSKQVKTAHFQISQVTKLPRAPITQGQVAKQNYVQNATGDYDFRTGDFEVKTNIGGATIVMRQVGKKQYWEIAGNWYEVPQAIAISPPVTQALSVSQYIKYFESLKKLPDANVQGEGCYHVTAVPNMKQLVKQPGVTDLLKDPTGKQVYSVDELEGIKAVFEFFVQKSNGYFKRSEAVVTSPAPNELIKIGFAEPGDKIKETSEVTFSDFDKKLDITVPPKVNPWPGQTPQG